MRLFHFSDDPTITTFVPRPVRVPSKRPPGQEWLNGPLVWAIDADHAPLYLFPRDCPRILVWPVDRTSPQDRAQWFGQRTVRMRAFIEARWSERVRTGSIYRYEMAPDAFEPLNDAGMWVARQVVSPLGMDVVEALPEALMEHGVELEALESLAPLKGLWATTLHASGLRLRNTTDWPG